jgi:hypothetical protein
MTADPILDRLTVAHEVFLTACRLFVLDSRFGEMQMTYLLADQADPARLGDVTGKYVKRATGYAHVLDNGNAQWVAELPAGVSSNDVVVDPLDVSRATPLQDRLRAIEGSLRSSAGQDAEIEELVDAIEAVLEACHPDNGQRCLEQIQQWVQSEVFVDEPSGGARKETERAHRLLDHLAEYANELQGGPLADGKTVGGVLAIRTLVLASAAGAESPEDEADALMNSLFYVSLSGPPRVEDLAMRLCARLVGQGHGKAIREAAEGVKAEGDGLIARALAGEPLTFYASLYPAAAYELAVVHIGQAAAEASDDPGERTRWAKFAVNAEERAVRISTALGFALLNLDGSWTARHQGWLRQVSENAGADVARLKARNLIDNQFFYPSALMPILLSEELPPDDRSRRS